MKVIRIEEVSWNKNPYPNLEMNVNVWVTLALILMPFWCHLHAVADVDVKDVNDDVLNANPTKTKAREQNKKAIQQQQQQTDVLTGLHRVYISNDAFCLCTLDVRTTTSRATHLWCHLLQNMWITLWMIHRTLDDSFICILADAFVMSVEGSKSLASKRSCLLAS